MGRGGADAQRRWASPAGVSRVLRGSPPRWTECGADLSIPDPAKPVDPYDNCLLVAVDPATARATVLAHQPELDLPSLVPAPTAVGIWVTGRSRGQNAYAAAAVSHDRGRTWSVSTLGAGETVSATASDWGETGVLTVEGTAAYALVTMPVTADLGSRTGDGRRWIRSVIRVHR
ncbi:hypothetical protein [Hamadaea tsunoensis]|uniref:hypothetical protein n=1 Tax=Hamadaea tsunoensis TaxID=53368 RepID=UPI00040E3EAD|nr:hypothetical protein [Hamadaea tsunoensis]